MLELRLCLTGVRMLPTRVLRHASRAIAAPLNARAQHVPASAQIQATFKEHGKFREARHVTHAAEAEAEVAAAPSESAASEALPTGDLDLRVGKILSCEPHPDADSLYVESIEVGEPEPRTIVSGLVKFVKQEDMLARSVVVICNLKARNMRGVKSHGMVLCASDEAHENVEPLSPPEGAEVCPCMLLATRSRCAERASTITAAGRRHCSQKSLHDTCEIGVQVGERIYFEEGQPEPAKENRVQKKKLWEGVQPELKTLDDLTAAFKDVPMMTSAGAVTAPSLKGARIS